MVAQFFLWGIFLVVSIPIIISDYRTQTVPNYLIVCCALVQIGLILIVDIQHLGEYLLAGAVGFLSFLLIRILSKNNLGMGDVLFAAIQSATLGIIQFVLSVLLAIGVTLLNIFIYQKRELRRERRIAFTPFMYIGAVMIMSIKIGIIFVLRN